MASCQNVSAENIFLRDKFISEELRALANEYNCIMITASQLGRGSLQLESQDDVSQANIAGGISKINTTDNAISIMQDAQQKARGEMKFKLLKTRSSNGVGNSFMLRFSSSSLLLENFEDKGTSQATSNLAKTVATYASKKKPGGLDPSNLPFQV